MSTQARSQLVGMLHFTHASQKSDLLDPGITDTLLIQMLLDVVHRCQSPILITAMTSDHQPPDGGPGTHGHSQGFAFDGWNADYTTAGDGNVVNLLRAVASSPYVWTVGAGGKSQQFVSSVQWPQDGKFILFTDNNQDHVHVQAGNPNGKGLR